MKVVFAHTDFRLYWPARLAATRDCLREHGVEMRVVEIAGQGSPYAFAGGTTERDWWRCLFPDEKMENIAPERAGAALCVALDELNPDVVFAGAIAFPSGATALRWARRRGRKVVLFNDARLGDVPRNWLVNAVKRRLYAQADAMFIPAPSHAPDYEFWGMSRERMFFGLQAVNNEFFARRSDMKLEVPARFILGVGRQVAKKNWGCLLEAWRQFGGGDRHLVLIGNGPERGRLEAQVRGLRNVQFRDFVSQETLAGYYHLAQALVLPSVYGETWGNVVNEAMAAGLPVLVSRQCGCAATLVEHGGNGWMFDPHQPAELAVALKQLADCPETERAQMGERSRQIIGNWGLKRFCDGVWAAMQCLEHTPARRAGIADRLLLNCWKGRYRPT